MFVQELFDNCGLQQEESCNLDERSWANLRKLCSNYSYFVYVGHMCLQVGW